MRVLHLVTRLNIGGITRHLAAFLPHLKCEYLLAAGVCVDEPEEPVPFDVLRLPHLVRPVHPVKDVLAFWEILSLLRGVRPDILHTHMAKAGWLGRLAARAFGIPCVHTYHGSVYTGRFGPLLSALIIKLERLTVPLLNGAIYVSASSAEAVTACVGQPKHKSIIPPSLVLPESPRETGVGEFCRLAGSGVVVGWMGRMVKVKRPELAVSAVAEVDGCRLVMAGDGEARAATEELAAKVAPNRVEFLGWIPKEQVAGFLRRIDLFLMTSVAKYEGFPVSLMEVLHAGVPVVAVEAQGVVDVMGTDAGDGIRFCDAGVVCKEGLLAEALRQAIERLDEMKSRVAAAWERIWRMVNPKAVAEAHLRFYQRVLGSRSDG